MKKLYTFLVLALTAALGDSTAHAEETTKPTVLMGSVVSSSQKPFTYGMYSISTTEPKMELVKEKVDATGGGTYANGKYYCQTYMNLGSYFGEVWANFIYDTDTWEFDGFTGDITQQAFDMAYDHTTNRIYGCFMDAYATGKVCIFGTLDMDKYTTTRICDTYEAYVGMAVNNDGTLFALTKEGLLYTLDKKTGDKSLIGNTGLQSFYNSSATIDRKTGVMYYVLCTENDGSALYSIDTATAQATKIYDFPYGEEIMGLYVFEPKAEDGAPALPENPQLNFEKGNLAGTLTFTAPTLNYGGTALEGAMTYTVTRDDTEISTGQATPGQEISVDITVEDNGEYSFKLWLSNAHGNGPFAKVNKYIGFDDPGSVPDVKLSQDGEGNFNLTWTKVNRTLATGYFDADAIRYRIIRYPDEVTVVESQSENSFSEPLPQVSERTNYYYTVTAINGTHYGSETKSNFIGIGAFTAPYENNFQSETEWADMVTINANDDTREWKFYNPNKAARIDYHRSNDMDDYLVTPMIVLEGGKTYEFTLAAYAHKANTPERIAAYMGTAQTKDALTTLLVEPTEITAERQAPKVFTVTVTPQANGEYCFAAHACSPADSYYLYVDRISIKETSTSSIESVLTDDASAQEAEYYNLQGTRVSNTALQPGIYIMRRGTSASKVIVR